MDDLEAAGDLRVQVAAALGREYSRDLRQFLPFLAKMLEDAMPEETRILTRGFLKKELSGIEVHLASDRYIFEDIARRGVVAKRAHIVRGIALKTEELSMEEAILGLAEALEARAAKNHAARTALANLIGL